MAVTDMTERYQQIYDELRQAFKWSFVEKKVLMHAAMTFAGDQIPFETRRFTELTDRIARDASFFSPLKYDKRITVAAILESKYEDPFRHYQYMKKIYDLLIEKKFKRGSASYSTALVILSAASRSISLDQHVDRTMAIHKGMKKEHPFITSEHDYPLASLLADQGDEPDVLMIRIEDIYQRLAKEGFRKGNDLQFLSHILSLDTDHEASELVRRTTAAKEKWKESGMKHKGVHYPVTGLLALAGGDSLLFEIIADTAADLNSRKAFRWEKDWNSLVATNFTMKTTLDPDESLTVSMYTSLNTILEAQNAAMVAAASAGAGAGASSNN